MVYLGTEYYDFRIVFVFSSIFGINYECGYSLCVEKCSGMPKSCVEKCSGMAKSCVEKCSEGKPLPSLPKREGLTNLLELLAAKSLMI